MYLYWDHSIGTSLGKGSKRIRQQKMTEKGVREVKKSDMPHTNSSVYFLLKLNLYSFFVSHKAVIILQQQKEHIQEKAYQCLWNNYIIFAQKCYNSTTLSMWLVSKHKCV